MERSDYAERIEQEIRYCLTFEEGNTCLGAGERKRRRVCVWCPNYRQSMTTGGDDGNGHSGNRGGTGQAGRTDQGAGTEDGQPGETDGEREQAGDQRGTADGPAGGDGHPDRNADGGRE